MSTGKTFRVAAAALTLIVIASAIVLGSDFATTGFVRQVESTGLDSGCATEVTLTARIISGNQSSLFDVPVRDAMVAMLAKRQVMCDARKRPDKTCCKDVLNASCVWKNLQALRLGGDTVEFTEDNGKTLIANSVADPDGWVIYIWQHYAHAGDLLITSGMENVAVENAACAKKVEIKTRLRKGDEATAVVEGLAQ